MYFVYFSLRNPLLSSDNFDGSTYGASQVISQHIVKEWKINKNRHPLSGKFGSVKTTLSFTLRCHSPGGTTGEAGPLLWQRGLTDVQPSASLCAGVHHGPGPPGGGILGRQRLRRLLQHHGWHGGGQRPAPGAFLLGERKQTNRYTKPKRTQKVYVDAGIRIR